MTAGGRINEVPTAPAGPRLPWKVAPGQRHGVAEWEPSPRAGEGVRRRQPLGTSRKSRAASLSTEPPRLPASLSPQHPPPRAWAPTPPRLPAPCPVLASGPGVAASECVMLATDLTLLRARFLTCKMHRGGRPLIAV